MSLTSLNSQILSQGPASSFNGSSSKSMRNLVRPSGIFSVFFWGNTEKKNIFCVIEMMKNEVQSDVLWGLTPILLFCNEMMMIR